MTGPYDESTPTRPPERRHTVTESTPRPTNRYIVPIAISWLIVGIPLVYGLVETLQTALKLFG